MKLQMDARQISEGVWLSDLSEADLAVVDVIAKPALVQGDVSVLLLTEQPTALDGHILLTPSTIKVLNRGRTRHAVIVPSPTPSVGSGAAPPLAASAGDNQFLSDLPAPLRELGTQLLTAVRSRWPGVLQLTSSGRFVDGPDNFWTVKIQPRDESLRITVRGEPKSLQADPVLNLKADRPGYSTFKISQLAQVQATIDVLARARRR